MSELLEKILDIRNMNEAYKKVCVNKGAVESRNKIVLQDRLKQAGMRWEPETAQYVLSLKVKSKSELWEKEVVKLIRDY